MEACSRWRRKEIYCLWRCLSPTSRPFWRKKGSVTNWLPLWLIGFKALRALRLEYLWIPTAYIQTASWYPERDKLNKYGRPALFYWDVVLNLNWDYLLRIHYGYGKSCLWMSTMLLRMPRNAEEKGYICSRIGSSYRNAWILNWWIHCKS